MFRWNALILATTFLISISCQMAAMGDLGRMRSDASMEYGAACCEPPEEAPESSDENADEAGDCFERHQPGHPALMYPVTQASLTGHYDEKPAGFSPSCIEPPPPEC